MERIETQILADETPATAAAQQLIQVIESVIQQR